MLEVESPDHVAHFNLCSGTRTGRRVTVEATVYKRALRLSRTR